MIKGKELSVMWPNWEKKNQMGFFWGASSSRRRQDMSRSNNEMCVVFTITPEKLI